MILGIAGGGGKYGIIFTSLNIYGLRDCMCLAVTDLPGLFRGVAYNLYYYEYVRSFYVGIRLTE